APSVEQADPPVAIPAMATPAAGAAPALVARGSRLTGLTHPVWDGVSLPTLRYWLRWWQDESKSAARVENGWRREEQIERIGAEIAAREAAGLGKRPPPHDAAVGVAPDSLAVSATVPTASPHVRTPEAIDAARAAAATRGRLYRES